MIFEFLDAEKRRIEMYTDNYLITGTSRRELVDRVIKDSVDLEFTLELLKVVQKSTYILLGGMDTYRTNPMYRIMDISYDKTVRLTGISQTLDRAGSVDLKWDGVTKWLTETFNDEEEILYETEYVPNKEVPEGEETLKREGRNGLAVRTYLVTYKDGQTYSRVQIREKVIKEPVSELIEYGTGVVTVEEEVIEEEIPYDTSCHEDDSLPEGEVEVVVNGEDGLKVTYYKVTYLNGLEKSREKVREENIDPTTEIIRVGTGVLSYEVDYQYEVIEYDEERVENKELPLGEENVLQEGEIGYKKVEYRLTYLNGVYKGREYVSETVDTEPIKRIVEYGTYEEKLFSGEVLYKEEVVLDFEEETEFNVDILEGYSVISRYGTYGSKVTTYKDVYEDGYKVVFSEVVDEAIIEPINAIIQVGVKENPDKVPVDVPGTPVPVKQAIWDEEELVKYDIVREEDANMLEGYERVGNVGEYGLRKVTKMKQSINGSPYQESIVEEEVLSEVRDATVFYGSKYNPEMYPPDGDSNSKRLSMVSENVRKESTRPKILNRVSSFKVNDTSTTGLLSYINKQSEKIGFNIILDTRMTESQITQGVFKYVEPEFTLDEAVNALLQVIDGVAEFDTIIDEDYVAKTTLRISDNIGEVRDEKLMYGYNLTEFGVDERVEDIVTAVEYIGVELDKDTEERLTLDWYGTGVKRDYVLPNSKRKVRLEMYDDINGRTQYVLEDKESTNLYGYYTNEQKRKADPIVETRTDGNITKLKDLIDVSVEYLDGKSLPRTKYNITALVEGIDVADYVDVKVPHLGIDRRMPVLSVEYNMGHDEEVYVTVGEYLPTDMERVFEEVTSKTEGNDSGGGTGGSTGKTIYDKDGNAYKWNGTTYDKAKNPYIPGGYDNKGNWQKGGVMDKEGVYKEGFMDNKGEFVEDDMVDDYISSRTGFVAFTYLPLNWEETVRWNRISSSQEEPPAVTEMVERYMSKHGNIDIVGANIINAWRLISSRASGEDHSIDVLFFTKGDV